MKARVSLINCLVSWLVASPAVSAPPLPVEIERVTWGFADRLEAERWTPVTLWISSKDGAVSGIISTEYRQDGTQGANIITPFATTPGTIVPVEVLLCVPSDCEKVTFNFTDGDRDRRIVHASIPAPDERQLATIESIKRTILILGVPNARVAFEDAGRARATPVQPRPQPRPARGAPPSIGMADDAASADASTLSEDEILLDSLFGADRPTGSNPAAPGYYGGPAYTAAIVNTPRRINAPNWELLTPIRADTSAMPLSWMGYDGVEVVISTAELGLDQQFPCDARAFEALVEWVKAGGRLVVQVEMGSTSWARFAALPGEPLPVQAGDASEVAPGPEIAHVLSSAATDGKEPLQAAAAVRGRRLTLTEAGARRGWRVRWRGEDVLSSGEAGDSGLLAEGPLGFGMVTLVGVDPTKAASVLSTEAGLVLWRDALIPVLSSRPGRDPSAEHASTFNSGVVYYGGWYQGSGADRETRDAQGTVLDRITDSPTLGHGLFFAISACICGLALLVGPVDMLGLKRLRASQHSWMTALAWISLASAAASIMPSLVRSGESRLFRLVQIDAIRSEGGTIASVSTGITSIFSGKPGGFGLKETADGAWWRGISPLSASQGGRANFAAIISRQGTLDGGRLRGNTLMPIRMGQWTCRALLDRAAVTNQESDSLPEVRVFKTGDGWSVEIGDTANGRVSTAALLANGRVIQLIAEDKTNPGATTRYTAAGMPETPPENASYRMLGPWETVAFDRDYEYVPYRRAGQSHGAAFSLPGSRDRTASIEAMCATGKWACVYLLIEDMKPDKETVGEVRASVEAIVRLVVPVE